MNEILMPIADAMSGVKGYVYPNELKLLWSVLIVVYPYVTGLVAGAFILASLVRVFNVRSLEPAYRLALLTSLAFLLAAPLPLLFHLGQPQRGIMVMITPHLSSPMAIFGFVYAWYLMAVLMLELWFDYRSDMVRWGGEVPGYQGLLYRVLTLGIFDVSEPARRLDHRLGRIITVIGIPSAFLLHGYVGFIFGSVKANPLWGNVLMPIIFIFSAMVSGIALCVFLYQFLTWVRHEKMNMKCLDTMGVFLFYSLVIAATIESLDWIHRLYEAEESIHALKSLVAGKLFFSMIVLQASMGTIIPLVLLGSTQVLRNRIPDKVRFYFYGISSILILVGVFAMRWNVVIGGQLFSKSLLGFTTFKLEIGSQEGLLVAMGLIVLPFLILWLLIKLFLNPSLSTETPEKMVDTASKPA